MSLSPFTDGIYGVFTHFSAPSFHELNSVIQRSWQHVQTDKLQKPALICQWANAHFRQRLALWRGVLVTDKSRFSACRADGRRRVWRGVDERFADANVVDLAARGGGGVMVWAAICYGQQTQAAF